jgi:hypothetical protein
MLEQFYFFFVQWWTWQQIVQGPANFNNILNTEQKQAI